jgi:hypothetical protein
LAPVAGSISRSRGFSGGASSGNASLIQSPRRRIERYDTGRSFDLHVTAQHAIAFRNSIQPFIGAPYDEREYSVHP